MATCSFVQRHRAVVDDRHNIRNPISDQTQDSDVWLNTLLKERVCDLFRSERGIAGHAHQIQCEINRASRIEGLDGARVQKLIQIQRKLKEALIKAKEKCAFSTRREQKIEFPLLNDMIWV